jgi:hypothetical protein
LQNEELLPFAKYQDDQIRKEEVGRRSEMGNKIWPESMKVRDVFDELGVERSIT